MDLNDKTLQLTNNPTLDSNTQIPANNDEESDDYESYTDTSDDYQTPRGGKNKRKRRKIAKRNRNRASANQGKNPMVVDNNIDNLSIVSGGRYSVLSEVPDDNDNDKIVNSIKQIIKKPEKPPAIIIHGKMKNHKDLYNLLRKTADDKFTIKYTKNNTNVMVNDSSSWNAIKQALTKRNISHHSYTPKSDKTHAFVITGLDQQPEVDDIKSELIQAGIAVKNVFEMKNTHRPKYLITTDKITTLKSISQIKYLCFTKISFSRHYNNKLITQCHRCQLWGHVASNCAATPKCLKCAKDHLTYNCTKTREEEATCANCSGKHTANSTTCPEYIKKVELINNRNKIKKPTLKPTTQKYVPAPVPESNVWHNNNTTSADVLFKNKNSTPPITQSNNNKITATATVTNKQSNNDFNDLKSAIRELNEVINLRKYINSIRQLTSELKGATSEIEKFQIVTHYFLQLDDING